MNVHAAGQAPDPGVRYFDGERSTRPWGSWEVLATGLRYTLKRLVVLPGQRLSLQYHHHRAEHWTIVEGRAEVEIDGTVRILEPGDHAHIPVGAVHRIRNAGAQNLAFIEVQIGEILDEQDIVRLADDYDRQPTGAAPLL